MQEAPEERNQQQLLSVIRQYIVQNGLDGRQSVLVVGGTDHDRALLVKVGLPGVTLSNLEADLVLDAEALELPAESYDVVFAHAVLHHCQSPHKALCEMLRVARRHVMFIEPNDSVLMRWLTRMRLSFPYEIPAVVDSGFVTGGLRNSCVPNYIFRWTPREVYKTAACCLPERSVRCSAFGYWDFYVTQRDLELRTDTRVAQIARAVGASRFIALLQFGQRVLNTVPVVRRQGNKFFAGIAKGELLHPWLCELEGEIVFNREYIQNTLAETV
jgi:SAM-dependent methyltransferase